MTKLIKSVLALAALAAAASAIAWGTVSATATSERIDACVGPSGLVRITDAACKRNEQAVSWNVRGAVGPAGPQGEPGPAGETGPAGATGAGIVSASAETVAEGEPASAVFDAATGNLHLRLPRGPQGPEGPQGEQGGQGAQGPAGTFAGTYASPNGLFSLAVTNGAVTLTSPGGHVSVTPTGVSVHGAGTVAFTGAQVSLNGGVPVARVGDPVGATPTGPILAGSATVTAG